MDVYAVIATIGGIALLVGIFGGGVEIEKIKIPPVPPWVRIVSTITGVALLAIVILLTKPELLNLLAPAGQPSVAVSPTQVQAVKPTQPSPTPATTLEVLARSDYGPLLYEETFDKPTGAWSLDDRGSVKSGKLTIQAGGTSFLSSSTEYDNFIVEVGFQHPKSSPSGAYFSLFLRETYCSPDKLCGYQIFVASDGSFGVKKYSVPTFTSILPPSVAYSFTPTGLNTLTIAANGNKFKIYLNGSLVGEFSDSKYSKGKFHLDTDIGAVEFDYFRIYALP